MAYNVSDIKNKNAIRHLLVENKALWQDKYKVAKNPYREVYGIPEKTSKLHVNLSTIEMLGPIRRLLMGEKIREKLLANPYSVDLESWYKSFKISIYELSEAKDQIKRQIKKMANMAKRWETSDFVNLINNSLIGTCITGSPFFSHTHAIEGQAFQLDNLMNIPLNATNLKAAITRWDSWRGPTGEFLQGDPNILLVASDIYFTAVTLMESKNIVGSNKNDTNVLAKLFKIIKVKELPAGYWMLLDTTQEERPFNLLVHYGDIVKGIIYTQDEDLTRILHDMNFTYGIDGATGGYYGYPWTALLSTGGAVSSS